MKVMLLCGGKGTRIREVSETRPKPMVEIGGHPILWHVMNIYAAHGLNEFICLLGYKGREIKEYFLNYEAMNADFTVELGKHGAITTHEQGHNETGWKITLAETGENTMTGGRLARGAKYLDGDDAFALTYGDGVTDVDLKAVLAYHRKSGSLATVTGVRPPSRFGELETQGDKVLRFSEKPQVTEGFINGGFFFFHKDFLRYVNQDEGCILEREPLERCARDGQLSIYKHDGYWQCMDTLRDWEYLNGQWSKGAAPWKVWK
ncbi:MAG: glucose-1-phosphate cytidylyltransferase [Planctomycetota bacterium]